MRNSRDTGDEYTFSAAQIFLDFRKWKMGGNRMELLTKVLRRADQEGRVRAIQEVNLRMWNAKAPMKSQAITQLPVRSMFQIQEMEEFKKAWVKDGRDPPYKIKRLEKQKRRSSQSLSQPQDDTVSGHGFGVLGLRS
mmetsp:Transcript_28897/g.45310  ORF Transcript_28897/g.45310 Transcript_28897/m.45310 type:complete len:137 (+) Transcript_28897:1134-1544(+)